MVRILDQFEHDYESFVGCAQRFGRPEDSERFLVSGAMLLGLWSIDSILADMRMAEKMGSYAA